MVLKDDGTVVEICKVKGIRLNYKNSQKINFDTVKSLVCEQNDPITVHDNIAIRRTQFHDVVTRTETKICRPVFNKRRFIGLSKSFPYRFYM